MGGILGVTSEKVENCYNLGNVEGDSYVGGIVGGGTKEINNCYNKGNISGPHIGGIVGRMNGKIINSYNMGDVLANTTAGGIAGAITGSGNEISNCFNVGKINTRGTYPYFLKYGGILGNIESGSIAINNCYNTIVFSQGHSTNRIGGIVGASSASITMNKCYYLKQGDTQKAISGTEDDINQVTGCNDISEITATILNDNINNKEHTDEWRKWKMGEEGYPVFE